MPAARRVYNGMLFARDPAAETSLVRGNADAPALFEATGFDERGRRQER
jgi:hypothetical protein